MLLAFVISTRPKMQTWTPDHVAKGFWDTDPKVKNFGQHSLLSHYFWLWATNDDGTKSLVSAFARDGGATQVDTMTIRSQTSTEDDISYMEDSVKSMCRDGMAFQIP
jgi:hypothetical protein